MAISSTSPITITGITSSYYNSITYGQTNKETFDLFIPTEELSSTPLVMYIHGGGFTSGDKSDYYDASGETMIQSLLDNGIAFMNINYDLMETNFEDVGVINSLNSCQKALQYIKYYASDFNIDNTNILLYGTSAGAGASMYLGYNIDLGNPSSDNLIERETTNDIAALVLVNPQATYDMDRWEEVLSTYSYDLEDDYNNNPENAKSLNRFYSINSFSDLYTSEIIDYRSDVDMLQFITDNDGIPTWVSSENVPESGLTNSTLVDILHNPEHAITIRSYLLTGGTEIVGNINGLNSTISTTETASEFIIRQLT